MKRYIERRIKELNTIAERCRKVADRTPPGSLSVQCKESNWYYTLVFEGNRDYLHKGDPIIEAIQTGYCAKQVLEAVENDIRLLTELKDGWASYDPWQLDPPLPKAYQRQSVEGLRSMGLFDPEEWKNRPYRKNPNHPEHLKHRTKSGLVVRSRGEAFIANTYEELGIPFHYEEELILPGGRRVYPDFTLLIGQVIKWHEHNGMMSDQSYLEGYLWKEQMYVRAGIIPYRDVLFTFDGAGGEFDMAYLDYSIRRFVGKL